MIDRQRVAAVKKLEELGYTFADGEWMEPGHGAVAPKITDALHALLVKRADELAGSMEGSDEERELAAIKRRDRGLRGRALAEGQGGGWQGVTRDASERQKPQARQLFGVDRT